MSTTTSAFRRLAGLAADNYGCAQDRPPLLLLHGLTFDRTMWRPTLEELRSIDPDRRVVALDLPGHGESPDQASYDPDEVLAAVHAAAGEAGLDRPVVVGHSLGGIAATVYAARFPTRGAISVDQSLDVGAFGEALASARGALMGPAYLDVWDQFRAGFHAEVLPKAAQELVRSTSRPRQELLLGYWRLALDGRADEFVASAHEAARVIGASGTPYVHVAGAEPGSAYRAWLAGTLPQARIEVWPASGHFPHLAHPRRFARLLAETATWTPGVERLAA